METVICGASAFQYWRTPPIVSLLAGGPSDYPGLSGLISEDELIAMRQELAVSSPLTQVCQNGPAWRHAGPMQNTIREWQMLLSPGVKPPIDVLVSDPKDRRSTGFVKTTLWRADLPFGSTQQIAEDLSVTSPAFTMLQIARRSSLPKTVILASELCGGYAVFRTPLPIAKQLQRMIRRDELPCLGGWRPCLTVAGMLTDLWARPALIGPDDLVDIAERSDSRNGRANLLKAAELVRPGSASPFETQAGILLGFPRRLGGEGLGGFTYNEKAVLSADARLLAQRECCYCDLYWPEGVDVECQSALYHKEKAENLWDSDRTAALQLMGIEVLPLTFAQLKDERRFEAFTLVVERALGRAHRAKTANQAAASLALREEVLARPLTLPDSL